MKASDLAYLAALVEKSPSTYSRRIELLEELQDLYRKTQGNFWGSYSLKFPIMNDIAICCVEQS